MYQIILASGSPRRKEIMDMMGIPYQVLTSNLEEITEETNPSEIVKSLAVRKTRDITAKLTQDREAPRDYIIIGADTMVFYGEHALGKPKNEEDALRILSMLSDDMHDVFTGVSIIIKKSDGSEELISFSVKTKVVVMPLTRDQIMDYIATGEPMDKAGAYAIQGKFGIFIKEIIGDYYNVVGFPIARIYATLLERGIDLKKLI
jgi:septum formation protein